MTRTAAREIAIALGFAAASGAQEPEEVFEQFFDEAHYATLAAEDPLFAEYPDEKQMAYIRELFFGVAERRSELDGFIERYSRGWKAARISKTAAAILRSAMYEILYMDDIPDAAAINEAVELSKGYDDHEVVVFLNGVLGGFIRGEKGEEPPAVAVEDEYPAEADAAPDAGGEQERQ